MKWISLLLQLVSIRRSVLDAQAISQQVHLVAEKSKRVAISLVFLAVAALFAFSALLVGVIELGLLVERGAGVYFSGLMLSASLLAGMAFLAGLASYFAARSETPPPPPPPRNDRAERVKDLLEEFLVSFLAQWKAGPTPSSDRGQGSEKS